MVSTAVKAITSNPLHTRSDAVDLLLSLLRPVIEAASPCHARVSLAVGGTHYDPAAAELEGFARALWGLAPAFSLIGKQGASHRQDELISLASHWRIGLEAGTNPSHSEFWGWPGDFDQRYVEMAAISVSIALAREVLWDPLEQEAKNRVNKWLLEINIHDIPDSNWQWFRVITSLDKIDTFYLSSSHAPDGSYWRGAFDYYASAFALPFYAVLSTKLGPGQAPDRLAKIWTRIRTNALYSINLFAADGSCIPYGRSLTYRFGTAAFWASLAWAADNDALEKHLPEGFSWGVLKGLVLRTTRWFSQKDSVFNGDVSLSIGWSYPSLLQSEAYNSPQSPYWALKVFIILGLPEDHPFWMSKEEPLPPLFLQHRYTSIKQWCQVFSRAAGHTFVLNGGDRLNRIRQYPAKYCKLAYSSHFGFSVEGSRSLGFAAASLDSTIAISEDGHEWSSPSYVENAAVFDHGTVWTTWKPYDDVTIWTWLIPPPDMSTPWHTRIHRIRTGRSLRVSSAGFSVPVISDSAQRRKIPVLTSLGEIHGEGRYADQSSAIINTYAGVSGVLTLLADGLEAAGEVLEADPSTNVIWERTAFPAVTGSLSVADGTQEGWLAVRIFAQPRTESGEWQDYWNKLKPWRNLDEGRREIGVLP